MVEDDRGVEAPVEVGDAVGLVPASTAQSKQDDDVLVPLRRELAADELTVLGGRPQSMCRIRPQPVLPELLELALATLEPPELQAHLRETVGGREVETADRADVRVDTNLADQRPSHRPRP
jgi:hypothetical protein